MTNLITLFSSILTKVFFLKVEFYYKEVCRNKFMVCRELLLALLLLLAYKTNSENADLRQGNSSRNDKESCKKIPESDDDLDHSQNSINCSFYHCQDTLLISSKSFYTVTLNIFYVIHIKRTETELTLTLPSPYVGMGGSLTVTVA